MQAQTIRSGTITATADAQGQIRVELEESAGLLSGIFPRQVVYTDGEAIVDFTPTSEGVSVQRITDELGRGRQLTLRGLASIGSDRELMRRIQSYPGDGVRSILQPARLQRELREYGLVARDGRLDRCAPV